MRDASSLRGFIGGVLVGILVGSAGMAAAAFGYNGWQQFTQDFRVGYVTGYLDMANIIRGLKPGGFVDENYAYLPNARPAEWAAQIDTLYKDPANQKYAMPGIIALAGRRLEDKYGKGPTAEQRALLRFKSQLEQINKRNAAKGEQVPAPDDKTVPVQPKAAAPHAPEPRKWCRCDGTDPKEARAQRRAAAEAEDAKYQEELMQRAAAVKAAAAAGAEKPAPGTEKATPAIENTAPGTEKSATGTEKAAPGTEKSATGQMPPVAAPKSPPTKPATPSKAPAAVLHKTPTAPN